MRRDMRERGASQGTVIALIVIIVVALGAVAIQLMRGGKSEKVDADTSQERQLYCLGCKKGFVKEMTSDEHGPLLMAGPNAPEKMKCPECGEEKGIGGVKCGRCGEIAPAPGAMAVAMSQGVRCPKCKATLMGLTKADGAPDE